MLGGSVRERAGALDTPRPGLKVTNPANRTQITRALLRLRELILSGEFAPGERMSELPLVERLGVSRTPLRLALAALEHEGLLLGLDGGGYVVREFTQSDIRDAIELRGVLEGTGARFAAERGATRRDLRALRKVNDAIEELVHRADFESFERYVDLNEGFHARLLRVARSPLLERALDGIISLNIPQQSEERSLPHHQAEYRRGERVSEPVQGSAGSAVHPPEYADRNDQAREQGQGP